VQCIACGVYNKNREACKNCGTLLSYKKRQEQRAITERQQRIETAKNKPPGYIENLKNHKLLIFRVFGWVLYSGFTVVSAIGAFIAWLVFAIAAG
jgi:uncharacterized membrane protein YvbJ